MSRRVLQLCIVLALALLPSGLRAEPPPKVARPQQPAIAADPTDCDRRLGLVAVFTRLPPASGPGECGGVDLVKLEAVTMLDRSFVTLTPAATLRCGMAAAVAEFVRQGMGPAALELGSPLLTVATAASYDCRNRNNLQGAKVSEHAHGNALDLSAVRLKNRTTHNLASPATPEAFRMRVRDAACRYFTTVLGPGSDPYHAEHVHLDRAERRHGYRMCQWDVRPPEIVPLPQPKPAELAGRRLRSK